MVKLFAGLLVSLFLSVSIQAQSIWELPHDDVWPEAIADLQPYVDAMFITGYDAANLTTNDLYDNSIVWVVGFEIDDSYTGGYSGYSTFVDKLAQFAYMSPIEAATTITEAIYNPGFPGDLVHYGYSFGGGNVIGWTMLDYDTRMSWEYIRDAAYGDPTNSMHVSVWQFQKLNVQNAPVDVNQMHELFAALNALAQYVWSGVVKYQYCASHNDWSSW